jgi:hypothetical protein
VHPRQIVLHPERRDKFAAVDLEDVDLIDAVKSAAAAGYTEPFACMGA